MTEAPIWQQDEGRFHFDLEPAGRGAPFLVMVTYEGSDLGPVILLDPIQAAALRDALTAWLDEEATA